MSAATQARDPVTGLTQADVDSFQRILGSLSAAESKERLKDDLLTAIHIELATIPIYLYTYYSIARKPPDAPWTNISDLQFYAGKAGALIMSVAVEEMLHMSLASNIYFALFNEPPELYGMSPAYFPAQLPYHNPVGPPGPDGSTQVAIPLSKLSFEQLWHFLQIEYPDKPGAPPLDQNWNSLSQFYQYIQFLMGPLSDADFKAGSVEYQIQPYNYSVNNIDTLYAPQAFNPWLYPSSPPDSAGYKSAAQVAQFVDAPDSHRGRAELLTIDSKQRAFNAMGTISDQGEGANQSQWDDRKHMELSHFFRFLTLQAQIDAYIGTREQLPTPAGGWPPGLEPLPPLTPTITTAQLSEPYNEQGGGGVVYNYPDNPITRADPNRPSNLPPPYIYPESFQALSDFCNGIYQYMLILTETTFKVRADRSLPVQQQAQKLFFNQAMHRSMIWMLDKIIQEMRRIPLGDGHVMAPTFENISLGDRKDAWQNLQKLYQAVPASQQAQIGNVYSMLTQLPDVSNYW